MVDLSVYDKIVGYSQIPEQNRAKQFEIDMLRRKQYLEEKKAQEIDVDKLGEQAFMKAAMGEQLSPQELAAAQYVDAKSGGIVFDPVTGQVINKPRISDKIGLGLGGQSMQSSVQTPRTQPPALSSGALPLDEAAGLMQPEQPITELDIRYQQERAKARNNPRLLQQLDAEYAKNKITFTEGQSNAATYADRMREAEVSLGNPKIAESGLSLYERAKSSVPGIGNLIISPEYRQLDQAQRNFINATLRRESGAVISPEEFANAKLQYFPQPGDDPQTLANKAKTRQSALEGISRSAGAAYIPKTLYDKSKQNFDAKKNGLDLSGIDAELARRGIK